MNVRTIMCHNNNNNNNYKLNFSDLLNSFFCIFKHNIYNKKEYKYTGCVS